MNRRNLGFIGLFNLIGCHPFQNGLTYTAKSEIRIKCTGPRLSKSPLKYYTCIIDVFDVTDHDRWLIFPSFMEVPLPPHQKVVLIQGREASGGFLYCGSGDSDSPFEALPIRAGKRLHLEGWELDTMDDRNTMPVWLGAAPSLSNGETLSAIFQRLLDAIPQAQTQPEPGIWRAPKGTTIELAPKGFHVIQINPPPI